MTEHIFQCSSLKGVHSKYTTTFTKLMRDKEIPNDILHMLEVGIGIALSVPPRNSYDDDFMTMVEMMMDKQVTMILHCKQLQAGAQVWIDALRTESLVPIHNNGKLKRDITRATSETVATWLLRQHQL